MCFHNHRYQHQRHIRRQCTAHDTGVHAIWRSAHLPVEAQVCVHLRTYHRQLCVVNDGCIVFANSLRPTILRKSQKRIGPAHFFSFSKDVSLHFSHCLAICSVSNDFEESIPLLNFLLLYRLQKRLLFLPHKNTSTGISQQETA